MSRLLGSAAWLQKLAGVLSNNRKKHIYIHIYQWEQQNINRPSSYSSNFPSFFHSLTHVRTHTHAPLFDYQLPGEIPITSGMHQTLSRIKKRHSQSYPVRPLMHAHRWQTGVTLNMCTACKKRSAACTADSDEAPTKVWSRTHASVKIQLVSHLAVHCCNVLLMCTFPPPAFRHNVY